MFKSAVLSLALLATTASWLDAQAAYAPGTARYRVTREAKSTQDMQGDVQSNAVTTLELLTLDIRPAVRDSMRFTFTIDSASRVSDMPGGETTPKGRKISGQFSPRGVVHAFDKDSTFGDEVTAGYRNFLPHLPTGRVKAGTQWADTLRTPFSQNGIEGTTLSVISSRVLGDTTIGTDKAWRIERLGTLSMSGTGNQGGADLILTGSGTAAGVSYVGTNGVYLGAKSTQELSISVEVPAASMTIPIKQITVTTVERIPGAAR